MKLSNLKIGTRLYLAFGSVVAILAILLAVAHNNFSKLAQANDWNIHTYEVLEEVNSMLGALVNIETGQRGFSLTGNEASLEPYQAGMKSFRKHLDEAKRLTSDNQSQQDRLQKIDTLVNQWLANAIDPALALRRNVSEGKEPPESLTEFERAGKGKQVMDALRVAITEIDSVERKLLEQRALDAASLQSLTSSVIVFGGLITVLLAGVLAVVITRGLMSKLGGEPDYAAEIAGKVASGDLAVDVVVRNGDHSSMVYAMKQMKDNLASIVTQVRNGTDTIASASSQIASGNQDLSSRTEQQASSLEETASSMEELTSTVKQNADNARQANTLAATASEVARKGGTVIGQVVDTMSGINASANKIVDIISVIDGIAFQTNILALNAAVEAARAGEQGRGFAVVASEVRTLAQRSANAAKEIKTLIDDSVSKVESGSRLVNDAGATMTEIVESVKRVTDIMQEITAASTEQTAGIEQINQAIAQMDQVTQQNAALVEEAAAASRSMQDQSATLAQVVSVFKLDGRQQAMIPAATPNPMTRMHAAPAAPAKRISQQASATSRLAGSSRARVTSTQSDWEEF